MKKVILVIIVFMALQSFSVEGNSKESSVFRLEGLPDLSQTDPQAGFDLLGYVMCGPVAVSNSLVWLGLKGYRDLVDLSGDPFTDQVALARLLAGEGYMNTRFSRGGTSTINLLKGLERYITGRGYEHSVISYYGWNYCPERFAREDLPPSPGKLKEQFSPSSSLIINLGWYHYDPKEDCYTRDGGHWVTMAGHGEDYILINDPAPWSGRSSSSHRVILRRIEHGFLKGDSKRLPRSAWGYYMVSEGLPLPKKGVVGIIDGVVLLEMEVQFPGYHGKENPISLKRQAPVWTGSR